ncbi:MAG: histidinol phosphate phosphatase [Acidimicrobiia bacterium]|nr:histidinol phosphate phosphatase [Acidimicrobiia bacterium]
MIGNAPAIDIDRLELAAELVRQVGELTLARFGQADLRVDHKGDGSPVTDADRAAEEFLRVELGRRFPHDTIIGEELADTIGSSPDTWTIDPIDGTQSFARRVPLFTNLLALTDEHGPAIGVINAPAAGELVVAGRGRGCTANGERCRVSTTREVAGSLITTSGYDYWDEAAMAPVHRSGASLRTWGDGYGYVMLATGRADVVIDPGLQAWDVAPMNVVVPESGGTITGFDGRPIGGAGNVVATNGLLHDAALRLVA